MFHNNQFFMGDEIKNVPLPAWIYSAIVGDGRIRWRLKYCDIKI